MHCTALQRRAREREREREVHRTDECFSPMRRQSQSQPGERKLVRVSRSTLRMLRVNLFFLSRPFTRIEQDVSLVYG